MENNQQSFWQFSDDLRLQSSNLANLSLNDAIWGNSLSSKRPEERRNFDVRVGGDRIQNQNQNQNFNGFNDGWKVEGNGFGVIGGIGAQNTQNQKNFNGNGGIGGFSNGITPQKNFNGGFSNGIGGTNTQKNFNGGFSNGVYLKPNGNGFNKMNNYNKNKEEEVEIKAEKKKSSRNHNNSNGSKDINKNSVDKRFKTLPATEALPRNEVVGGYIFVCNNDTMEENLKRQLFGLPPRYRDSVRAITPGLPLFLYNYSTHQLHGIFEAAGFGGTNIDPTAWEDKKCIGESRFPAQVRVAIRKICNPLEEDSFRPILHHYDGPKFRLELNIPEALALLDIFADDNKA